MQLKQELKIAEVDESVDAFRERLINRLMEWFPGRTIDGLICRPAEALRYCDQMRSDVGSSSLCDIVILKALVNIRKQTKAPTGLLAKTTRRNVKNELMSAGCDLEPDAFKELATDCLSGMYKDTTIDETLCHPREALALCNYVRQQAGCTGLADEFILSTIMNYRKAINS